MCVSGLKISPQLPCLLSFPFCFQSYSGHRSKSFYHFLRLNPVKARQATGSRNAFRLLHVNGKAASRWSAMTDQTIKPSDLLRLVVARIATTPAFPLHTYVCASEQRKQFFARDFSPLKAFFPRRSICLTTFKIISQSRALRLANRVRARR